MQLTAFHFYTIKRFFLSISEQKSSVDLLPNRHEQDENTRSVMSTLKHAAK